MKKIAFKDFLCAMGIGVFGIMTFIMVLATLIVGFRTLKALCMGILNLALWGELGCFILILGVCIGVTRVIVDASDGCYRKDYVPPTPPENKPKIGVTEFEPDE